MSPDSDLIIPYSSLDFEADDRAAIAQPTQSHDVISALLMQVVRRHAKSLVDDADIAPVSVTIDVTGLPAVSGGIEFDSTIDRKTRTLIFISGEAKQGCAPLLKATAIYRIV